MENAEPKVRIIPEKKHHRMKRFMLPDGCDAKEIVVRELDGDDDMEIAVWTEAKLNSAIKDNIMAVLEVKKTEAARRSLVVVDGRTVNQNGIPFSEMDKWSQKTMIFVFRAYNRLNGAEDDDLKKFDKSEEEYNPAASAQSGAV